MESGNLKGHGEVRSQWHHVIDVAPTSPAGTRVLHLK